MHRRLTFLVTLAFSALALAEHAAAQGTVCKDGSSSVAAGRGACSGHGGVDAAATSVSKKAARAARGGPTTYKTVTCTDGSTGTAGRGACSHHGGVQSATAAMAPAPLPTRPAPSRPAPTPRAAPRSAEAPSRSTPNSGASARCRDGSLSYSANRRGTCSHHGGVAEWY